MRFFLAAKQIGIGFLFVTFAGCGFTLVPPGFVKENRHGVCRGWFDVNSYRRPSLTLERYDHLPPDSARVKLFRWRHGGSVEKIQLHKCQDGNFVAWEDSQTNATDSTEISDQSTIQTGSGTADCLDRPDPE